MQDNEITLSDDDVDRLKEDVGEHLQGSPSNRLKDMCKKIGISMDYVNRLSYDTLESIAYDLVDDINESGYSKKFLEYMMIEDPSGRHRYQRIIDKHNEELAAPGTFHVKSLELTNKIGTETLDASKEPAMAQYVYERILQVIYDAGKGITNHSRTHEKKSENAFRNDMLVTLGTHVKGGITGEGFNKSGKTDILVRHDGSNLFVAECKIWKGESEYIKAIDQLIGYLTLHDSKAALIIYVKNKNISNILETIANTTVKHSNHVRFVQKQYDVWIDYLFHINGDKSRLVKLAVIITHVPK